MCVFLIFWPYCTACGILVPQPGIKLVSPALEEQSLKHCTTGEVPIGTIFIPLTHFTAFWILSAWIPLPNPFLAYLGPTLYPRTLLSPGFCLGLDNRCHHRRLKDGRRNREVKVFFSTPFFSICMMMAAAASVHNYSFCYQPLSVAPALTRSVKRHCFPFSFPTQGQ